MIQERLDLKENMFNLNIPFKHKLCNLPFIIYIGNEFKSIEESAILLTSITHSMLGKFLRALDTRVTVVARFCRVTTFFLHPVCLPVHQVPYEKGSTLKEEQTLSF